MFSSDFWFSYKNILLRELEKKNYAKFLRRIFGILYKFIIRNIKHQLNLEIINLDNLKKNYFDLSLEKLFVYFNSDKGPYWKQNERIFNSHNYSIFYEKYFSKLKKNKINFLEIGSHEGKGLSSFFFYFPYSNLIGANINPFQMRYSSSRIREIYIDVSSEKILNNFSDHLAEDQDIIIDDASHNLRDILITFSVLFKKLKNGGIYIIEDMDQFKIFKELNPYQDELTPKEILKKIQLGQSFNSSFITEKEKNYLLDNIKSIKIEKGSMIIDKHNASDIAFIFKK